jgi:hypothetical protein
MIAHYLSSLAGIEWLGIASLLISCSTFTALVVRAARLKSTYCERMGRLPLESADPAQEMHA